MRASDEEREAASRRLMTEGGVGWRGVGGGRGKTGSSLPPQIKGADLDAHQRTQTAAGHERTNEWGDMTTKSFR